MQPLTERGERERNRETEKQNQSNREKGSVEGIISFCEYIFGSSCNVNLFLFTFN